MSTQTRLWTGLAIAHIRLRNNVLLAVGQNAGRERGTCREKGAAIGPLHCVGRVDLGEARRIAHREDDRLLDVARHFADERLVERPRVRRCTDENRRLDLSDDVHQPEGILVRVGARPVGDLLVRSGILDLRVTERLPHLQEKADTAQRQASSKARWQEKRITHRLDEKTVAVDAPEATVGLLR